jgi:DNA topoisomerase-1
MVDNILSRGYVWKKGTALVPSWTAFAVIGLLERYFTQLVDYGFTASMEEDLDHIAQGAAESGPWLARFYFGLPATPAEGTVAASPEVDGLQRMVSERLGDIDAREINSLPIGTDDEGVPLIVRIGRYGPYVQHGEERASIPEDLAPDELTVSRALELLSAGSNDRVLGEDPASGLPVVLKAGRFGPYVQVGEAGEVEGKPRTASLLSTMDPATVGLDDALRVLELPRVVGSDPSNGEPIEATNGRYGPYLKKGSDSRSLENEEQLFTVTLEEALGLFAQPKTRRGQRSAAPLRELGADPVSGQPILLKEGRFGPYVTDGETNASLRKGDTVEGITPERAVELLADRRAAGPPAKRTAKKAGAKKVTAKKAATPRKAAGGVKKAAGSKKALAPAGAVKKAAGATKKASAKRAAPRAAAAVRKRALPEG